MKEQLGITGRARVNGRNAVTFAERFKLNVLYVDNPSLWSDIKIILITAWKTFSCEGITK